MEFRQVVHSVCRTATSTAAAAVSASTTSAAVRPTLAGFLLHQHRPFTTNNNQQHEAAAVAARPAPIGQFQQRQPANPQAAAHPPRPPPAGNRGLLDFKGFKVAVPKSGPRYPTKPPTNPSIVGWATPARAHVFKGRLTGAGSSSMDTVLGMPARLAADMQRATGDTMKTWDINKFTDEAYGPEPELRLRPATGRTVEVRGNIDFARGLRLLNSVVSVNNLRADVRNQRFHERPALKRKRNLRERWRVRFRAGFAATRNRVFELKAQGW